MNKEELFFKIEAWLDGALSPEEAAAFEREIGQSPDLALEIERQRQERQAVEYLRAQQLREKMRNWQLPPPEEESLNARRSLLKTVYWLVLVIAIVAGIVYVGKKWLGGIPDDPADMPQKPPVENKLPGMQADIPPSSADSLSVKHPAAPVQQPPQSAEPGRLRQKGRSDRYASLATIYFEKKDYHSDIRGDENMSEDSLFVAVKGREENRLADAAVWLRSLSPDYPQAQEMLGQVLFEQGKYRDAAAVYETLARRATGNDDKQQFQWKRALCLLAVYPYEKTQMETILDTLTVRSPAGKARELKARIRAMERE